MKRFEEEKAEKAKVKNSLDGERRTPRKLQARRSL